MRTRGVVVRMSTPDARQLDAALAGIIDSKLVQMLPAASERALRALHRRVRFAAFDAQHGEQPCAR